MRSRKQEMTLDVRSRATLALAIVFGLTVVASPAAQAQTFTVLHSFTEGADGGAPYAGVTMDNAGNLYGTTYYGGIADNGTVYKLLHKGSGWAVDPLYLFTGSSDGANPQARVIFGPDGALYGTASAGGHSASGTVFKLRPPPVATKPCSITNPCPWLETVLYQFAGSPDGATPGYGDLLFDQAGNIYDTTIYGGVHKDGVVYELTGSESGWTESPLYSFGGGSDGAYPVNGMARDNVGNLYSTTHSGGGNGCYAGMGCGTVFELTPSGSGWTEKGIYRFQGANDGNYPIPGLIFGQAGNLYGATNSGGTGGGGTVFELSPNQDGSWKFTLLYSLGASCGSGPTATLVMDGAGNLYGTTYCGGANQLGNVFKLTPTAKPPWTYTSLYDFTCGNDGGVPIGGVTLDTKGNLYGTASICAAGNCGGQGCGVVWEITP